jgi:hypothetical protein
MGIMIRELMSFSRGYLRWVMKFGYFRNVRFTNYFGRASLFTCKNTSFKNEIGDSVFVHMYG